MFKVSDKLRMHLTLLVVVRGNDANVIVCGILCVLVELANREISIRILSHMEVDSLQNIVCRWIVCKILING